MASTSSEVQQTQPADHPAGGMLVGYARVSTVEQNLHLQQDALTAAGCKKLFKDTLSGAREDRPGLDAVLDYL